MLNKAYTISGKCEVTLMKQEIVTSLDSMAVQKHSQYLAQIDQGYSKIKISTRFKKFINFTILKDFKLWLHWDYKTIGKNVF